MKRCLKCKTDKDEEEYHNNKSQSDGLHNWCKSCVKENNAVYYSNHREERIAYIRGYSARPDRRKRKLLLKARERAEKEGIEFSLSEEDFDIPEYCPYLGVKLTHELGKGRLQSNSSIDRIDSSRGYIKGNVQVISFLANTMKSNASEEQLIEFAKNILKIHKVKE